MSPSTVSSERRLDRPVTGTEMAVGLMTGVLGYTMDGIVERMLTSRGVIEQTRWTFDEEIFPNVAAMERAFGLLTTAPLSADQASQERILRARRNTP